MFSLVMPSSSAFTIAKCTHATISAKPGSLCGDKGPSGSFESVSGRIMNAEGSAAVTWNAAIPDLSVVQL